MRCSSGTATLETELFLGHQSCDSGLYHITLTALLIFPRFRTAHRPTRLHRIDFKVSQAKPGRVGSGGFAKLPELIPFGRACRNPRLHPAAGRFSSRASTSRNMRRFYNAAGCVAESFATEPCIFALAVDHCQHVPEIGMQTRP